MPESLKFTIVNSQVVTTEREAEIDGAPATIRQQRLAIEAIPVDPMGKTFSTVLPVDVADDYPEGATITLTLTVDAEDTDNG